MSNEGNTGEQVRDPSIYRPDSQMNSERENSLPEGIQRRQSLIDQKKRHEEEINQLSEPFCFVKFVIRFWWLILLIIFIIQIICIILTVVRQYYLTNPEGGSAYMATNNIRAQEYLGMVVAEEDIEDNNQATETPLQSQSIENWQIILIFKSTNGGNMFTSEHLKKMKEHEDEFKKTKDISMFCKLNDQNNCEGFESSIYGEFKDQVSQELIDIKLKNITDHHSYLFYFHEDSTIERPDSKITRSFYEMAAPIEFGGKRYRDKTEDFEDQEERYGEFALDAYNWGLETLGEDVEVYIMGYSLMGFAVNQVMGQDMVFALLSIIFVWIYSSFHLQSFFLSSFGILQVILVFPPSWVLYRDIYGIYQYSVLQLLVIFILLGISADNFFVFNDTWTQAIAIPRLRKDIVKRLAYTFRRAVKAILITSGTTAVAFLSTCFSPLMPIASFGIWASTCVTVNFILTITMFPCLLTAHEKYIKYNCCYNKFICCKEKIVKEEKKRNEESPFDLDDARSGNQTITPLEVSSTDHSMLGETQPDPTGALRPRSLKPVYPMEEKKEGENSLNSSEVPQAPERGSGGLQQRSMSIVEQKSDLGVLERFFDSTWTKSVNQLKIGIVVLFLGWMAFNIYLASEITALSEQEQWMPDGHYIRETTLLNNEFKRGSKSQNIPVFFLWGVEGLNEDGADYWNPNDKGSPIWQDDFDVVSTDAELNQLRFIEICDLLEASDLVMKGKDTVKCFMKEFRVWVEGNNQTFPVPKEQFLGSLLKFTEEDTNGKLLRKSYHIGIMKENGEEILKTVKIEAAASCNLFEPPSYYRPIYDKWETLEEIVNKGSPIGMNNMIQVSEAWAWLDTFDEFISSAIQGMLIAITFAFVVLLISTLNIIIAFFATFSVAGIVLCVMGVMKMCGWEFGITESISCVVLIGFSVDYVVHLAAHYTESSFNNRYDRMRESLKQIGISIFGGAITTLLAGSALFFCTVIFFQKFAVLITSSIAYSLGWSLLFFTALCFLIGPQGKVGDLKPLILKIKGKCCPGKENKISSETKEHQNT